MSAEKIVADDAEVLAGLGEIAALERQGQTLLAKLPSSSRPRFFLASVNRRRWIPWVVAVKLKGEVRGLAYFKERRIGGVATGLLYADGTLGPFLAAEPGQDLELLDQAINILFSRHGIRGVRIRVAQESPAAATIEGAAQRLGLDFFKRSEPYHSCALLPDTYPAFLASLSMNGRHSVRLRRRRFEEAGHGYVEFMDAIEFRRVALSLLKRSVVGAMKDSVERALRVCSETDRPILSGLRSRDGEWMAILGGWYEKDHAVWFFQLNNDRDYPAYSLGTVLRSYFVESLIRHGCRKTFFWASTNGPIARSAQDCPSLILALDQPTLGWRAVRAVCRKLAPHLPKSSQVVVTIAPTGD